MVKGAIVVGILAIVVLSVVPGTVARAAVGNIIAVAGSPTGAGGGASLVALTFSPDVALSQRSWSNACGDGRVDTILDDFNSTSGTIFKADPTIPDPIRLLVVGCHGNALALDYNLTNVALAGQSWIVLRRTFPAAKNLTAFTHLRLAIRGSNINSHDIVDVKLRDGAGHLHAISLQSITDLPVWRPIYIDVRELSGSGGLDLTKITDFEIGTVRCAGCEVFDNPSVPPPAEEHTGTLYLDEFAAVDLKPGAANRLVGTAFEKVTPNPTVLASAANALLGRITPSGPGISLVPAWFPETNPNFNSYVQAEALLVFVYEYERTGNVAYRDAARNIAARLISLQIPSGKAQAGAWYTAHTIDQGTLRPPNRALPPGQSIRCDGNETMVSDPTTGQPVATNIDACEWAGNVGWVLIALGKLQRSGVYDNPAALKDALDRGAAWVTRQSQERGNRAYPNLITLGIEGNISAYFGLLAAGKKEEAALLGNAIFQFGWDPVQRRVKPGVTDFATALDVSGSWGVTFLRSIGKMQEALDSQAYAASVLRITSFDGSTRGYGDIAGPYTVAVEFAAQAASAGIDGANFVMRQIHALQIPSGTYAGAFPGAPDHWYGGQLSPWSTTMPGVSPTAWVYFASNLDPLSDIGVPVAIALAPLINTGHLVLVSSFNYATALSEAFVPGLPGNVLTEIRPNSVLTINLSVAHTVVVSGVSFPIRANTPTPVPVGASVTITVSIPFQQGMNYVSWLQGEYCTPTSDEALKLLAATGARWVAILVTGYQETVTSTTISRSTPKTPTDADLICVITTAHKLKLGVVLKPHVDVTDPAYWRGEIGTRFTTEDQWRAWFDSYREFITHYAAIAKANGVEQFVVGTELKGTTNREQDWRDLTAEVRRHFKGPITYASNHSGEEKQIKFWDALDLVGVDAYYPLTGKDNPTVAELKEAWVQKEYVKTLEYLANKFNRPIIFTELGYRSIDGANQAPWDWQSRGQVDLQEQADAYQAFFETFWDKPWFMGVYWWNWLPDPQQGGRTNTDYTPQNKPAQEVLKSFYLSTSRN